MVDKYDAASVDLGMITLTCLGYLIVIPEGGKRDSEAWRGHIEVSKAVRTNSHFKRRAKTDLRLDAHRPAELLKRIGHITNGKRIAMPCQTDISMLTVSDIHARGCAPSHPSLHVARPISV